MLRQLCVLFLFAATTLGQIPPGVYTEKNVMQTAGARINDTDFDNWGFEKGLEGWTRDGEAFILQPTYGDNVVTERVLHGLTLAAGGLGGDYWKGMPYPIGIKGDYWIGTYEGRPTRGMTFGNTQGDGPIGTLTSPEFIITRNYCEFLIGGGSDSSSLHVELQVLDDNGWHTVGTRTSFRDSEVLYRTEIDLHNHLGAPARIRIVDNATGGWGHINVDDFRFADQIAPGIPMRAAKGTVRFRVDADAAVWGIADTHAHPAAEEAFGGKVYVGRPDTPMEETFADSLCVGNHSAFGHRQESNDAFTAQFDAHVMRGWPDFIGFPRFKGKMHQKYHVDFLKRAWQGGLRLMSALAINNMYLASRILGHGDTGKPIDDESVMYRELDEVKAMAADPRNSSWMEIAYTPQDARRIIHQGKLAIVLGVEADVFGNFKSPDCKWGDAARDKPLVTITESNADALLDAKLDEYYRYGIRQVLPIHYLSKPFGGAAVFNGGTFLPQISFYENVRVKGGVARGVAFSLYEDFSAGAALVGDLISYADYSGRIRKLNEEAEISMVNADGLTPIGRKLYRKLMERHFIVDQEHVSYDAKDEIFEISRSLGNYPVMASHADPLGLSFQWKHRPVRWSGAYSPSGARNPENDNENMSEFGTVNIRNIGHEMQLNDDSYRHIRESRGTVGVFMTLNRKRNYVGSLTPVADNCAGCSNTFAQMYMYTVEKLGGRGVALASDFPMVEAVAPRFGPFAAWAMASEGDWEKRNLRTTQRYAQRNGVAYDVPSRSYHHDLFNWGDIETWEEDAWKALAAWEAGANPFVNESAVSLGSEPGHLDRVRSYARGLFAESFDQLRQCCGATPWEEAAMFLLKNELYTNALPEGFWRDHAYDVSEMRTSLSHIYKLWMEKRGTNEPLRRYRSGNRDWDYNLDGLAHIGLLPDFVQDLRNIGVGPQAMTPMFRSAEDYIQMWEKSQ